MSQPALVRGAGVVPLPWALALAVVALLDTLAAWAAWTARLPVAWAIAIHAGLALAALVLVFVGAARAVGLRATLLRFTAVMTVVLGPLGLVAGAITWAAARLWMSNARMLDAWFKFAVGDAQPDGITRAMLREMLRADGRTPGRAAVASFHDTMLHGTVEQKQSVLALIAAHFQPGFAPALAQALKDPEPSVRVLAASAAAQIEGDFLASSMKLETRLAVHPGFDDLWRLAQLQEDYGKCGILDDARSQAARERALQLYEQCDRLRPGKAEVLSARARQLVGLGRHADVATLLETQGDPGRLSPEVLSWYIEALYDARRFGALRDVIRSAQARGGIAWPARMHGIIAMWGEGAA